MKGSGNRMLRGKAERMRLRICMHEGGIASQKAFEETVAEWKRSLDTMSFDELGAVYKSLGGCKKSGLKSSVTRSMSKVPAAATSTRLPLRHYGRVA